MPDISALASALSSFKAAKDVAEAMIFLRDAAAFQSKLIEKYVGAYEETCPHFETFSEWCMANGYTKKRLTEKAAA